MFAFAGVPSIPTIQADMKDRRQFFTAVLLAIGGIIHVRYSSTQRLFIVRSAQ
jgi:hypothetical protein